METEDKSIPICGVIAFDNAQSDAELNAAVVRSVDRFLARRAILQVINSKPPSWNTTTTTTTTK